MNPVMNIACSECDGELVRQAISQEFEREALRVKISGVQAWVWKRCGEVYFAPGDADLLSSAVNSLFTLASADLS